ncbi:Acyl-coenzyme A synthetase ACSM3, mitochondrial [Fukomys damarensis]|uniref:Acyl-coenzyme A synthetase ACSM3, mitochondrial n=2 Tax=Fukomys damarensis TaxID=885580 RepID=A0A091DJC8_FUKDA|nr:Acyl-coenzyme A synthetase ACSM3, mitochondrial [Fukomys damarensis]
MLKFHPFHTQAPFHSKTSQGSRTFLFLGTLRHPTEPKSHIQNNINKSPLFWQDNPSKTASTLRGNFYITGDRGYMDEDGYFWFVARSDDVILSSGYRIGPFEVESALMEHPSVAESAVVSSPDPIRGEVVKAFIVVNPDYKSHDQEQLKKEIQEHVKKTTAPYKYPRKVEFIEALPKTISGKIKRNELRKKEWKRV